MQKIRIAVSAARRAHNQAMAAKKKAAQAPANIRFIESMECLPVASLPEGEQWSYEIKLYRLDIGVWTWSFAGKTCDEKRTPHVHG
jgi:hypothetical protein